MCVPSGALQKATLTPPSSDTFGVEINSTPSRKKIIVNFINIINSKSQMCWPNVIDRSL